MIIYNNNDIIVQYYVNYILFIFTNCIIIINTIMNEVMYLLALALNNNRYLLLVIPNK